MVWMWQSLQLEAGGEREALGRSGSTGPLLPLCSLDAFGISAFSFFLQEILNHSLACGSFGKPSALQAYSPQVCPRGFLAEYF